MPCDPNAYWKATTRLRADELRVLTVARSTPSTYTLADPIVPGTAQQMMYGLGVVEILGPMQTIAPGCEAAVGACCRLANGNFRCNRNVIRG